jgi:hypothetical protein
MIKSDAVNVEVAAAAVRPYQRASGLPDGQGGIRLLVNHLKMFHTGGNGGTQVVEPAMIGLSGLIRQLRVNEFAAVPVASDTVNGWAISADAMIPIIPVTSDDHGNKLTVSGSFQTGRAFSDQYVGFTGGIGLPAYPAPPMGGTQAVANIDPGPVAFDQNMPGVLHTVQWTVFLVGLQYYLPGTNGTVWLSGNFSQAKSDNIASLVTNKGSVYNKEVFGDGILFVQPTPALRFGAEYAQFRETFGDGSLRKNHRGQISAFFLF